MAGLEPLSPAIMPVTSSNHALLGRQDGQVIAIREDAAGGIKVSGIHAETCSSEEEMFRCLSDGSVQRTTGATLMNEQSSRCKWDKWYKWGVGALGLWELLGFWEGRTFLKHFGVMV